MSFQSQNTPYQRFICVVVSCAELFNVCRDNIVAYYSGRLFLA